MRELEELLARGLAADADATGIGTGAGAGASGAGLGARYSAAVGVIRRAGRTVGSAAVGELARYADTDGTPAPPEQRRPATESTVFDLASVTKIFTATVSMILVERGELDLDEPVARWLEPFDTGDRRRITLRHLLTHTAGLPADLPLWLDWPDRPSRVRAVLEAPLATSPGTAFEYSCVGYMVAGFLAERVTGRALPELVDEWVCRPLGLADTGFRPGPALLDRVAATEYQPEAGRGMVRGSVHDEASWSLGGTVGNAGVFGTAGDLARLGEMLRQEGTVDGVRVLAAETVREMTRDQLPPEIDPGYRHGLGVRIGCDTWMGTLAASGAYGHNGFTGTSLLVDRERELVVVLLANRVHPTRVGSDLQGLRCAVADLAATV